MSRSVQRAFGPLEVKASHRAAEPESDAVKKVHPAPDVPLLMAKARIGAAIAEAMGDSKREAYGHAGMLSAVCSGEKVPDYLARIYQEPAARRRLAFKLLEGTGVTVKTVVEWEEKVG